MSKKIFSTDEIVRLVAGLYKTVGEKYEALYTEPLETLKRELFEEMSEEMSLDTGNNAQHDLLSSLLGRKK